MSESIWKPKKTHQNVDGYRTQNQPYGLLLLFSVLNTYSLHMSRREHVSCSSSGGKKKEKKTKTKNEHFRIGRQVFLSISLVCDGMPHMLPVTYLFLRATLGAVYFIVCLSHSGMADDMLSSALVAARSRPNCRFCNWQASLDSSVLTWISVILNAWVTFWNGRQPRAFNHGQAYCRL